MAENESPEKNGKAREAPELIEEAPVETHHEINVGGKKLKYTALAGKMPIKNKEGKIEAQLFFTSYTLDGVKDASKRPLVFAFNGGPGSASVWLHLGALGPKRVQMQDEGWMPAPPFELVDNEQTWLDVADLVFIDPVGTGYSRADKPDNNKKFWNPQSDFESVGEVIRLYLTRYKRWTSPLFLAGESYGTTRAAGLAGYLVDKGIAFNGILLVSTVLNMQTLRYERGNDLPYILYVPTFAATAWYHQKLPADLQKKSLNDLLWEVEAWTETNYTVALGKGDRIGAAERQAIVRRLSRYTGLDAKFLEGSNLRIQNYHFHKELLRDQKRTVGRLDSRFKGRDALTVTETNEFDPSLVAITPPYTAMIYHHLRDNLGYETDLEYHTLSFEVNRGWEWDRGNYIDTSEALRSVLTKNPYMQVYLGRGLYDLATPHFATQYTFDHMDIDPELRDNISVSDYEAGHMYYLDMGSLKKFKTDAVGFIKAAIEGKDKLP